MFSIPGVRATCISKKINNEMYTLFLDAVCCAGLLFFWRCISITDLPVGRQDLMVLLKKLIRYIQIRVRKREIMHVNMYSSNVLPCLSFASYLSFCFPFSSLFPDILILRSHSLSSVSSLNSSLYGLLIWLRLQQLKKTILFPHREDHHNYSLYSNR